MVPHIKISSDVLKGASIVITIIIISALVPFLTLPFKIFIPLPVLFYRSKLDRQQALMLFFFATLIIIITFRGFTSIVLNGIGLMFVGLVLGELFDKNLSIEKTLLISSGIILACIVFCILFYSIQAQINIVSLVCKYIERNVDALLYVFKEAGISNELTDTLEKQRKQITHFAIITLPSSTFITIIFMLWINTIASKQLMQKNHIKYPDFGHLNCWKASENLIWGLISFGLILLIDSKIMQFIGINGLIITIAIYFFQGIAIISFYLEKKKIPLVAKIIIYLAIGMNQIFILIIIAVGISDIWLNLRKIK